MSSQSQQTDTAPTGVESAGVGRPTTFNDATAEIICSRLAGGETLARICRTPGMPTRQTVWSWRTKFPAFDDLYVRARRAQAEHWADEIIDIADDSSLDTVTKRDPKGREFEAVDHENIQRSRLMVDTRKFLMSKVSPQYADRTEHHHTGEVAHRVDLSDRERMRRLATFMLEDRASGVTIEGQAEPAGVNSSPPEAASDE